LSEVRALLAVVAAVAGLALVPTANAALPPVRWCGNDITQTDRLRDRMGGPQVHVIYAIPADGPDRFAELASPITTDIASIDAWWRREDPTKAPRFDLFEFPACESRFGLLDLTFARLPDSAATLMPLDGRFERIADRLGAPPFDFAELNKKYLVFYDGPVGDDRVCGTGSGAPTIGGRFSFAVVYLHSTCGITVGDGRGGAVVAAHELLHALGALPDGAPHACPGDDGHPCDSTADLLAPFYRGGALDGAFLDVNRDDYYAHADPWFDLQDSRWLLNAQAQVALTLAVSGRGRIGTEPDGQGCETTCTTEWDAGTPVQIAAEPASGYGFWAWTGPCAGAREPSCLLEVSATATVGAVFRPLRRVTLQIAGRGAVAGSDVRCTRACSTRVVEGRRLVLRATPARGWRFVRWSGGCSGVRPTCTVQVRAGGTRAAAVFARRA
jgi:Divergent InlB B-repeat domain